MGTRKPHASQESNPCEGDHFDLHADWAVREWPEIDHDVETIVNRIAMAHRYIERSAVDTLAKLGLTQGELKVLLRLVHGPRSHGDIARELLVSTGTMTNRLDKLETAGLVRRHPDPEDRRGVIAELTPEGRATLDQHVAVQAKRERQLLSEMAPEDRKALAALLREALASVEAQAGFVAH